MRPLRRPTALLAVVLVGLLLISSPVRSSSELRYRYVATGGMNHGIGGVPLLNQATGDDWRLADIEFAPVGASFSLKVTKDPRAVHPGVPVFVEIRDAQGNRESWRLCLKNGQIQPVLVDPQIKTARVRVLSSAGNLYTCLLGGSGSTGILTIRP